MTNTLINIPLPLLHHSITAPQSPDFLILIFLIMSVFSFGMGLPQAKEAAQNHSFLEAAN